MKIPTPIAAHGLYFLGGGSAHEKLYFYAVRAGSKGELKPAAPNEGLAWHATTSRPHVGTPLVYGDYLYVCTDSGVLTT